MSEYQTTSSRPKSSTLGRNNALEIAEDEDDLPDGSFFRRTLCPRKQFNPWTQAIRPAKINIRNGECNPAPSHTHYTNVPSNNLNPNSRNTEVEGRRQKLVLEQPRDEHFDLDYFLIINESFENNINNIKININISKQEVIAAMNLFPKKMVEDIDEFIRIIGKYANPVNYQCKDNINSSNCNNTYEKCKNYLPHKNDYITTYELYAKLLTYDFDKHIITLDEHMATLKAIINYTKSMISFKRGKGFLKSSAVVEVESWETDTLRKLNDQYLRIWKLLTTITNNVTTLVQRERELENYILNEIKQKIQNFACCNKIFTFQISGFYCHV